MTAITLIALALSVASIGLVWTRLTVPKFALSIALLFAHLGACIYNYNYTLSHISDSYAYYYDPFNYWNQPWGMSTVLVTQITHILRFSFGATYLDCFLLFQTFSMAGVAILARMFGEISEKIGVQERQEYLAILFLPSLHFWTVAIGKDSPLLFGISLCLWAMLNLRKRVFYFCLSILVMVLFRAHIALMAIISIGAAAFFGSSVRFSRKIAVVGIALAGVILVLGPVQRTISADVTSVSSVADFFTKQSDLGARFAGTTSIGQVGFAMRLVSLLFRPLFFDAIGFLGILASAENVLVVITVLYMIANARNLKLLLQRVEFIRFIFVFSVLLLLSLALVYYNIGLGLRQRVMAYPMGFSLLVALWSLKRKQKLEAAHAHATRLMVNVNGNRALPEL